jgi:hypothetical protein
VINTICTTTIQRRSSTALFSRPTWRPTTRWRSQTGSVINTTCTTTIQLRSSTALSSRPTWRPTTRWRSQTGSVINTTCTTTTQLRCSTALSWRVKTYLKAHDKVEESDGKCDKYRYYL